MKALFDTHALLWYLELESRVVELESSVAGIKGHISLVDSSGVSVDKGPMARPLRIEIPGGRYHITARGNERRNIFRDDHDRRRLLSLFEEARERFGVRAHAYVLMSNHYHLLLETPEPNLSRAGQWINVSYSVWFNKRHNRSGHLFQGRFSAVLIEDNAAFQEVGRYLHLNPVRVKRLSLGKRERGASRMGLAPAPTKKVVAERLAALRQWKWSSYPAYAGYSPAPEWLTMEPLGSLCGGRSIKEKRKALRQYTEEALREGLDASPWERVIGGVILGSQEFAEKMLSGQKKMNAREQRAVRAMAKGRPWESIVRGVEKVKGEEWRDFVNRHGDWGRDVALWLGQREGRMKLKELAKAAGGIDYASAGAAVSRMDRRLKEDARLMKKVRQIRAEMSKDEI